MTKAAGSAGTAGRDYKIEPPAGKHRAPPPVPAPRTPTVIAVAAAVLTAASLVAIAGAAVAPGARAVGSGTTVATTARETQTGLTAGPLVVPTVGVVAPAVESLYPTPSAPPRRTAAVSRATRTSQTAPEARSEALVAITTPSQQTVTPAVQPVTVETAAAPPAEIAAATTTSSATPTEEPTVTPTAQPTATVDVAAGVTP